jgi:hypothetical protein
LKIYHSGTDEGFRKGEIARTKFKLGLTFKDLGQIEDANVAIQEAEKIRREILGSKYFQSAGEDSYDSLVSPWAL